MRQSDITHHSDRKAKPRGLSLQLDVMGVEGVDVEQLKAAKQDVLELMDRLKCGPILIRLAWHDSGTYDTVSHSRGSPAHWYSTARCRDLGDRRHAESSDLVSSD